MTKKQAVKKINAAFRKYTKLLEAELAGILEGADMWYGPDGTEFSPGDRNADQLARDGTIDGELTPGAWLHTRSEIGMKPAGRIRRRVTV